MSHIDDLIIELCPDGVPTRVLGEVLENLDSRRRPVTRSERTAGKFPYYGANGVQDYVNDFIFDGTYLLVGEDGSVLQKNGTPIVNWATGKIWVNNHAHVLVPRTPNIDLRYMFHYLQTVDISSFTTGGTQLKLNQRNLNRIPVSVPPLEVQHEIVRILDRFTQLEAELEAELNARNLQYEYYRRHALTFDRQVELVPLSRICESISAGGDLPPRYAKGQLAPSEEFPYPIWSNGTGKAALYGFTDSYRVEKEAVTISARGTIGFHAVRPPKFTPIVRLLTLVPDPAWVSVRYLNYVLDASPIGHSGGSIPQLTVPAVKKIRVPVPSLQEQSRIVSVLSKFDMLINDLQVGLPAELEARRKQYEYYRDRLLTFKEAAA